MIGICVFVPAVKPLSLSFFCINFTRNKWQILSSLRCDNWKDQFHYINVAFGISPAGSVSLTLQSAVELEGTSLMFLQRHIFQSAKFFSSIHSLFQKMEGRILFAIGGLVKVFQVPLHTIVSQVCSTHFKSLIPWIFNN